jgi:L-threonylcarbamoyladenylate synthase
MYLDFGPFGCCSDHSDRFVIIFDYKKTNHKKIIEACVKALKAGKTVAYPTDTSYGLAVDATNIKAIKKLYQVKGRSFNKAVSVVLPSVAYAKKIVKWDASVQKLAKKFWPGALTLVLGIKYKVLSINTLQRLSARTGFLGIRMPKNHIALDLSGILKKPITATSANVAGEPDCYSAAEIIEQYKNQKHKPDIVINAGKLPKRKPSTLVKIDADKIEILRHGPISERQILKALGS